MDVDEWRQIQCKLVELNAAIHTVQREKRELNRLVNELYEARQKTDLERFGMGTVSTGGNPPIWYHCSDCGMRTSVYGPTDALMTNQCGYCGATSPSLALWVDPMIEEPKKEDD